MVIKLRQWDEHRVVAVCTVCRLCGWGRGKAGFSRGSVGVALPPAVQLHHGGDNCTSLGGSVELRHASEVVMSSTECPDSLCYASSTCRCLLEYRVL